MRGKLPMRWKRGPFTSIQVSQLFGINHSAGLCGGSGERTNMHELIKTFLSGLLLLAMICAALFLCAAGAAAFQGDEYNTPKWFRYLGFTVIFVGFCLLAGAIVRSH